MVNKDLIWVTKATVPFMIIQISVLLIITYMPNVVLWLPRVFGYIQ
jgi:C4-dicarboxylate transporter DctM subunit